MAQPSTARYAVSTNTCHRTSRRTGAEREQHRELALALQDRHQHRVEDREQHEHDQQGLEDPVRAAIEPDVRGDLRLDLLPRAHGHRLARPPVAESRSMTRDSGPRAATGRHRLRSRCPAAGGTRVAANAIGTCTRCPSMSVDPDSKMPLTRHSSSTRLPSTSLVVSTSFLPTARFSRVAISRPITHFAHVRVGEVRAVPPGGARAASTAPRSTARRRPAPLRPCRRRCARSPVRDQALGERDAAHGREARLIAAAWATQQVRCSARAGSRDARA